MFYDVAIFWAGVIVFWILWCILDLVIARKKKSEIRHLRLDYEDLLRPRRKVTDAGMGLYDVQDYSLGTSDLNFAQLVAAELDRVDPLPRINYRWGMRSSIRAGGIIRLGKEGLFLNQEMNRLLNQEMNATCIRFDSPDKVSYLIRDQVDEHIRRIREK